MTTSSSSPEAGHAPSARNEARLAAIRKRFMTLLSNGLEPLRRLGARTHDAARDREADRLVDGHVERDYVLLGDVDHVARHGRRRGQEDGPHRHALARLDRVEAGARD